MFLVLQHIKSLHFNLGVLGVLEDLEDLEDLDVFI